MAPFYRGYDPSFELDSDDMDAIQVLDSSFVNLPSMNSNLE
jgi:hypothetical protein